MGPWSATVDGLRARLVTSGSRADRSALHVALELENVGHALLEIHWTGPLPLGFVHFRLDDATGHEVPHPGWAFGGNEPIGAMREMLPPGVTVRETVADNLFTVFNGHRAIRIGAFWGRDMPTDGSRRILRARIEGRAPRMPDEVMVVIPAGDAGTSNRPTAPSDARGRPWIGPLEVPGVCID